MNSVLAAKIQHQQDANTVRRRLLVHQVLHLRLHNYLTKQQKTAI